MENILNIDFSNIINKIVQNRSNLIAFKCKTRFIENAIPEDKALKLYNFLESNIQWEEDVKSRIKGFTRLTKSFTFCECSKDIKDIIFSILKSINQEDRYIIQSIYLNYYKDGEMWTPFHKHKKMHQLVISLGEKRYLQLASKDYYMKNGDAIIFGSGTHGVPKMPNVKKGRISIATLMIPLY